MTVIDSYDALARVVDLSRKPPAFRLLVELDILAYGPIGRNTVHHYAQDRWPVSRLEHPDPPGPWAADAACKGVSMVYVTVGAHNHRVTRVDREMEREAIALCNTCPVLDQCRQWSLQEVEPAVDHVAGGLTPRERWVIRRSGPA